MICTVIVKLKKNAIQAFKIFCKSPVSLITVKILADVPNEFITNVIKANCPVDLFLKIL